MECLIFAVKGDGWKSRLSGSLAKRNFPAANFIEIWVNANGGVDMDAASIPQHNGDAWVFAHGIHWSTTSSGVVNKQFGIFGTPILNNQGTLFSDTAFAAFINAVGVKRLFVFACYQGEYVQSMAIDIKSLEHVEGLLGPAQMMMAPTYIESYFKDPTKKQLDVAADAGVLREEAAPMIANYAAALASVRGD